MTKEHCLFCYFKGKATFENEFIIVFFDAYPVSPGHSLIITKRHVQSFFQISDIELINLRLGINEAKCQLDNQFRPNGYNIGINDGEAAGQTIKHLHIHLIPRYEGDSPDPRGGIRWIFPEKAKYWENNE
jgi:diadenosine tetraphosphate (Ap4A) HIT family hydrolase